MRVALHIGTTTDGREYFQDEETGKLFLQVLRKDDGLREYKEVSKEDLVEILI